jgi:2-oxo-4-hydroxy-4-carboxy-5-ureidoimidazoline decarboxylase
VTSGKQATLTVLNALSLQEAFRRFFHCLGVESWARGMAHSRPFASEAAMLGRAETLWSEFDDAAWLEAFAHHPKIGDLASLRRRFAATATFTTREQAGVAAAAPELLERLAAANAAYEARFGFIFIVCATGKTAAEMLGLLEERLEHERGAELTIAAREQQKISRLRLAKLLEEP